MRQYLPLLALLPGLACAQVPNGGFENWTNTGGVNEPVGWHTYNDVPTSGGASVTAGTPGHPGSFYALITTRASASGGFPIQGWASAGTDPGHVGFPFAQRPATLSGQWQYGIQPNDTAQVIVAFSRWNGSNTEPLGMGTLEVTGSSPGWQAFSVPITWLSAETPDTAYIQLASSIDFDNPVVGSYMGVDDLAFSGTAGIDEDAARTSAFTLRSPAKGLLRITAPGPGTLRFFTADGRMVGTWPVPGTGTTLRVPELPAGILLYRFTDRKGRHVAAGKWVKE